MPESRPSLILEPDLKLSVAADGSQSVELTGAWDIRALESRAVSLKRRLAEHARASLARWDLTQVQRLDHAGALLIWRAWSKRRPQALRLNPAQEMFFANLAGSGALARPAWRPDPLAPVRALGRAVLSALGHFLAVAQLFGQMLIDSAALARHPSRAPWREISAAVYRTGAQALGITAAVGFLIGIVLSFLSSEQLKTFGANVFIVNILGIGIIREMGPMICAVLVAGRSGSAITAQLGVMRVTEELDALRVMGIPYTVRLILPKVLALALTMPLLILWTSAVALIGGAISAKLQLDIGMTSFFTALPAAVPTVNLWLGIGKGVVFGALIALVACHFGLRIEPNTESLGAGTTSSVVTSITAVILADAVFAVLFNDVGIALQ
ncbi:MAG: ABC transporter permease [Betaproteobacteria bacterium]|nr:ABC transporter permease [Betaproteobacteria bacterium]